MKRKRLSTKDRVALFRANAGICHICKLPIMAGQTWDVSHVIPLAQGGKDDDSNRAPAHRSCHRKLTSETDQPAIAKSKRIEAKHIGAILPTSHSLRSRGFSKSAKSVSREEGVKDRLPVPPRKPGVFGCFRVDEQ